MVSLRCPRCATTVEAQPGAPVQCPKCGFFAAAPGAAPGPATPPYASAATYAPPAAPAGYSPAPAVATYAPSPTVAGKPRSFWLSFLLGVVTLGVYFYIWNYVAFKELDRQHGEKHASRWYWAALIVQIIAFVVIISVVFAATADVIERQKVDKKAQPEYGPMFYVAIGISLIGQGLFIGYAYQEIAKVERYRQRHGLPEGFAPVWFVILYVLGQLFLQVTTIVAYFMLNRSINSLWQQVYAEKGVSVRV